MNKFYKIMFFVVLCLSSLITVSSYSWLMMWVGVEINMMTMIPIILLKNNNYSSESAMKYFLIQSVASTLLIFSILMLEKMNILMLKFFFFMTLQLSMIMKLGMFPMHFWLPEVMEGLSWMNCLIMLTWQKIAPFVMLMMTIKNSALMMFTIIFSSIISGMMGMNQLSLRKILTFSSMNHMSWMLMSITKFSWIWMIYFIIYSISNINLIMYFFWLKIHYINQLSMMNKNKFFKMMIMLNFFSLGGMPPFIGFMPKWLTIYENMSTSNFIINIIIIISSLMHIFFYLRITISSFMFKIQENKFFFKQMKFNLLIKMNFIFLMSLPFMNMFI